MVSYYINGGCGWDTACLPLPALPQATGRDNKYHQYFATITPTPAFSGDVTVSVKQFDDKVIPVPRTYTPLGRSQQSLLRRSLIFKNCQGRESREREFLTVQVNAGADTLVAAATAAYKAREVILDLLPNEIVLANKLVIPAGGYAVLTADIGKAGIVASAANLKGKVTAASKLYNTAGLGLPFPATIWITSSVTAGRSP